MQEELKKKINDKTSIVELVQEFVQLKKTGKNYIGLCPFHDEKTPSFSVSPEKNIAVCMSCKKGGNPIIFYKKIKNLSFNEAAFQLASRLGIKTVLLNAKSTHQYAHLHHIMKETAEFYVNQLKHNKTALAYLSQRGLNPAIIEHFKLGYAPKNSLLSRYLIDSSNFNPEDLKKLSLINQDEHTGRWYDFFRNRLIFPITDSNGYIIAFSSRGFDEQTPKYLNNPETVIFKKSEILYQYFENQKEIQKKQAIILHEGFFDVISSFQAGIKNVIATMGTNLTNKHIKLLAKLTQKIIIAYDGDAAGKTAALEIAGTLQKNNFQVKIAHFPDNLDPDEFIKTKGKESYQQLLDHHVKDFLLVKIDAICQQLNANNQNQIENKIKGLFQNQNFATKILYQKYLQQNYQLTINLSLLTRFQPNINQPSKPKTNNQFFDQVMHIVIEFCHNRFFFEKNYDAFDRESIYPNIEFIYLINKIKNYYNNNTEATSIPWEYFKNEANRLKTNELLHTIKKHHFFKNQVTITKEKYEKYIQILKIKKQIQELKEQKDILKNEIQKLNHHIQGLPVENQLQTNDSANHYQQIRLEKYEKLRDAQKALKQEENKLKDI
ncbi:DNA primase ['Fragaria x ananassa' phyllody phytoplasma]|uniref:DNA primase n=1 Tax='Fragaria x ananassa' phyllody phytoplasma TaxID=2358428 RepID=A0ABS5K2V4_9MOLU|nr:DNA primase ['Fragaria x ananassa' phyllody phytoplasma]MBS2126220.1 DNA primase ['Fragaria x ananassa' phyllody phytoplasma]